MNYFPNEEKDVFYAIDKSFSCYWLVLQKILPSAFLLTLVGGIATYGNRLLHNTMLYWLFFLIEVLVFLFFAAALLYQTNSILVGKEVSHREACKTMLARIIPAYATLIVFALFIVGYHYLFAYLIQLVVATHIVVVLLSVFSLAFLMVLIVFAFFSLPLIILDGLAPLGAIIKSYKLSKSRPAPIFTVYAALAVIVVAVLPYTRHAHFLMHHHVWLLYDFIVYCMLLPVIVNYLLFTLNDLKIRLATAVSYD